MKVHVSTFGCKVNQCESQFILGKMLERGYDNGDLNDSDVVVFNSCTVTGEVEKKLRRSIGKVKMNNPDAVVVLTGCLPQAFPNVRLDSFEADIIVGNSNKSDIPRLVEDFISSNRRIVNVKPHARTFENLPVNSFSGRTRAFLKIEDGCNQFCSYCIIPYARGRVRSKSIKDLVAESALLAENGYKEIVLVGINLACYGVDINSNLCEAVEAVCGVRGIERVRIGSLEPYMIDVEALKRLSNSDKLCPHFHVSLQSGSDKILSAMGRRYSRSDYLKLIDAIKSSFKDAAVTTDLIVGFPGETEDDFKESIRTIEEAGFLKVHAFPYSKRPGTKAAELPEQVCTEVKRRRVKAVIDASKKIRDAILREQIGKTVPVLYESALGENVYEGYAPNYVHVKTKSDVNIAGKILNVAIEKIVGDFAIGTVSNV